MLAADDGEAEAPAGSGGGFAQFMCCSTDSQERDIGQAPVDMFCFKGKAEEDVDAPGDLPEESGTQEGMECPGNAGDSAGADKEEATWTRESNDAQAHIFGDSTAEGEKPPDAGEVATVEVPAPSKRRASMAPKPVGEKKRMSIFEAMQSSMATAVGLGGDDDEVVVLEAILFKKGSGTGMGAAMFGKSSSFKKRKFELVKHCRDGEGADVGPVLRYFDAAGKQFKGAILLDGCEVTGAK